MISKFLLLAAIFLFASCVQIERNNPDDPGSGDYQIGGDVTYKGETYQTIVIGTQIWFKRNLNYAAEGSRCYNDDPANCVIYGRLYDWETSLSVCPDGWHLPSYAEWITLTNFVGGSSTAGTKLKATSGWNDYEGKSGNGTDDFGFSALPGGVGNSNQGSFGFVGRDGAWWSATEENNTSEGADYAHANSMTSYDDGVNYSNSHKSGMYSVRCLHN